jgi:signal transduction histidine kinase
MEYRLQQADGEYRWVLDKGVPRLLPDDAFAGYIGCCSDVTDLKQYHSRLHAAQKMESLGLMAAGVAHDFGNVLGAMLGEIDLALTEAPSETPGYDSIQRLEGLTMHASEMVRLLRESAGGSVDANPMEPLDLSYQVEQVLRLMNVSIAKHAHIRSKLQKDLPAVSGHVTTLRQLIVNLVANAAEALEGKEGSIEVTTDCITLRAPAGGNNFQNMPEGEYVRLAVSDTGRGMTSETRARIFDQFFTTKTSGRGLGLAVVHGIVRSHGGAINVTSAVDAGTTFEVLLPTACDYEKEPTDAFRCE